MFLLGGTQEPRINQHSARTTGAWAAPSITVRRDVSACEIVESLLSAVFEHVLAAGLEAATRATRYGDLSHNGSSKRSRAVLEGELVLLRLHVDRARIRRAPARPTTRCVVYRGRALDSFLRAPRSRRSATSRAFDAFERARERTREQRTPTRREATRRISPSRHAHPGAPVPLHESSLSPHRARFSRPRCEDLVLRGEPAASRP